MRSDTSKCVRARLYSGGFFPGRFKGVFCMIIFQFKAAESLLNLLFSLSILLCNNNALYVGELFFDYWYVAIM